MVPASMEAASAISCSSVPPELGRTPSPMRISWLPKITPISMTGKPASSRIERVLLAQMWVRRPTARIRR